MITAILVDDEQKSILNLEILLKENCPEVSIVGTASNAFEAVKIILAEKPTLAFLDIHMPGYSGMDVLEQIKDVTTTKVIFTTAHEDYAIQALRKGSFDYLLKPLDIDELKDCVKRALEEVTKQNHDSTISKRIELSVKDGIIFIVPDDIIRIEASGSYTTFYLVEGIKHMASKSMKEYELFLDPVTFYRCHNSHIINLRKVKKFVSKDGLYAEMSDGSLPEISRRNKDEFLEKLKSL